MSDKSSCQRMAEVDDSSSFEDDNKQANDSDSPSKTTINGCNSVQPEVLAPLHVNFYENGIGETSGPNSMVVSMNSDVNPSLNDKFFHANHAVDHSFRSSHSSNPSSMSAIENQDDLPFHQVIEIKDDKICDSRPPVREIMLYSCHFRHCGFEAPGREGLTDHLISYHNSSERDTKSNLPVINGSKPKEFQCDLCQMKFTMLANMQRHRMSHLGVRPFECRICAKKFTRNDHLMEHLVRQHSKQRPYKCPFCIKSYSMKPSLKAHLASDHSGIPKDKVCRICGFRATTVAGAKIHYTNTHLKNGASTPSTSKPTIQILEDGSETPSVEIMEEMDLARVSQNFTFASQENVSVPTSTASFNSDAINHSNQSENQSFRRYQSTTSFLPLPLCSSTLSGPIINPSFPGTSTMTDVSSSMREKTVLFPINSDNRSNEAPFLCSSSDLKQEPIDIDDGHNSCSSSAGAQPTSTMDTSDPAGQEDSDGQRQSINQGDEEDAEVGNHFAAQLRNAKANDSVQLAETTRRLNNSSEEEDRNEQPPRIERKPEINSQALSRASKYTERKRIAERKICHRPHCCDAAGESKVSTSVRNLPVVASNSSSENRRDQTESKPMLGCLHRKRSNSAAASTEQNALVLSREATEPAPTECTFCGIIFPDRTLYYLHRGMHSDSNPWKCNMCGEVCDSKHDFYAHVISREHR